jgi:hypothetical protein
MQVPPFKKVLVDTMPYIDYLFGNEVRSNGPLAAVTTCADWLHLKWMYSLLG